MRGHFDITIGTMQQPLNMTTSNCSSGKSHMNYLISNGLDRSQHDILLKGTINY